MTVYTVQAPDGKRLTLEGPPGASEADIFAQAQRLYQPSVEAPITVPTQEEGSGFLRQAADIPLKFGQGAVMGVRMIADAFGADSAASKTLRGAEDYIGELMSAQSKNDAARVNDIMRAAEDKGIGEQIKAGLKALTVAPVDLVSSALGTSAPIIAGSLLSAFAAPVGLGGAAALGTGVGLGAVTGAGTVKGDIHETVRSELMAAGVPDDKATLAADKAQEYGGKNLDQILLGTLIGGVAGATGVEAAAIKGLASKITGRLVKEGSKEAVEGMGKRALKGAAEEGITEFGQEGQEQIARNIASQREGFDTPTMRGVAGAATLGGALGALTGAGVSAVSRPGVEEVTVEEDGTENLTPEERAATSTKPESKKSRKPGETVRGDYTDEQWAEVKKYRIERGLDPETGEPTKGQTNGLGATGARGVEAGVPAADGTNVAVGPAAEVDDVAAGRVGVAGQAAGPADGGESRSDGTLKRNKKASPAPVEPAAPTPIEPTTPAPNTSKLVDTNAYVAAKDDPRWENNWFKQGVMRTLGSSTATNKAPKKSTAAFDEGVKFVEDFRKAPPTFSSFDKNQADQTDDAYQKRQFIDAQEKATPTGPAPDLKDLRKTLEKKLPNDGNLPVLVGRLQHLNNLMHDQGEHVDDSVVQGVIAPAVDAAIADLGKFAGKDLSVSPYTADNTALSAWEAKQKKAQLEENPDYEKDVAEYLAGNPKRKPGDLDRFKYRAKEKSEDAENPFALTDDTKSFPQWPAFKRYVASHTQTKAVNDAQQLARDAASALGRGLFNDAATNLHALKEMVSKPTFLEEHRRNNKKQVQDDAQLDLKKEDREIRAREKAEKRAERQTELAKNKEAKEEQRAREAYEAERIKRAAEVREKGTAPVAKKPTKKFIKAVEKAENERALPVKEVLKGMGLSPEAMAAYEAKTKELNEKRAIEGNKGVTEKVLAEKGQRRSLRVKDNSLGEDADELYKGEFSDELKEEREAVHAELVKRLKAVNLGHIALVVADKIFRSGDTVGNTVMGIAARDVISISLKADSALGTLNHEIIHVLKTLDLFTDKEWATLERRAKNEWMGRYSIAKKYPKLNTYEQLEEAIAEAFREAAAGRLTDGYVARLVRRIKNLLSAIGEALRGNGFNTVDDIFSKVDTGKIAKRVTAAEKRVAIQAMHASDPNEQATSIGELMKKTRNSTDAIDLLKNMYEAMSVGGLGKILYTLTTEDITRWLGARITQLKDINELVRGMAARRASEIRQLNKASEPWVQFFQKSPKGARVLSDLIHQSTLNNFDVSDYSTLSDALNNDPVLQEMWAEQTPSTKNIKAREEKLKSIWGLRNKLMGFEKGEGLEIYKNALDYYKKTFDKYYAGLLKNINDMGLEGEDKEKALSKVNAMFDNARKIGVYAPLSRFGNYWLRIGDGDHFQMFESSVARNAAAKKWEAYLKKEGIDKKVKTGNGTEELRDKTAASDAMLRDLFAIIDKKNNADTNELKDRVFQMYLAALPGSDIRKSMLHRKGTPGFDNDALRVFIAHNLTAANQLAKLEYGDKLRNSISSAYDALEPSEGDDIQEPAKKGETLRTNHELLKLKTVVAHMKKVVDKELAYENPNELNLDNLARIGNKAVFYYMLSAPKSAIVQMTQLPVVGFPVLSARYGLAKTLKVAARYSNFIDKLGMTKKEDKWGWTQPTVINSSYITNMKDAKRKEDLQWGFQQAIDKWDLFMNTYTADMTSRSHQSSASFESPVNKGLGKVAAIMSGSFHHMERMSREVMYMSAYELALDAGKTREEAADAAADAVYASLFNYTVYNKPLLMKSGAIPRIATQFMTFPVQMTSYLVRNAVGMIKNIKDPAERKSAAIQFFGTLGMTTMFAGVVGLPGYSLIIGLAEGIKNAMGGDDDDMDEDNPLASKSLKLWFEESFIPDYFGKGSSIAKAFGLSDEAANTLQRAVKMGPLSALTDLNIGSSVSLDGLWFRSDNPESSNKDAITQFAYDYGLGAFGSMWAQGGAAIDDFEAGHWDRGIEKLLPAFFRGAAKTLRFYDEGNLTREGAEVRDAEWYTTGKLMAQMLNISSTEVDELQKKNFAAKKIVAQMQKERTKILSQLDMAYRGDDEDAIDDAFDAVDKYNDENYVLPITASTIAKSLKGHVEARDRAIEGLIVDPKLAKYFDEMFEKSRK